MLVSHGLRSLFKGGGFNVGLATLVFGEDEGAKMSVALNGKLPVGQDGIHPNSEAILVAVNPQRLGQPSSSSYCFVDVVCRLA